MCRSESYPDGSAPVPPRERPHDLKFERQDMTGGGEATNKLFQELKSTALPTYRSESSY
jgi:hypothetical protein